MDITQGCRAQSGNMCGRQQQALSKPSFWTVSHLLVLPGCNLLQEVCNAFPLWAGKATALKEVHHVLPGPMVHQATYTEGATTLCIQEVEQQTL